MYWILTINSEVPLSPFYRWGNRGIETCPRWEGWFVQRLDSNSDNLVLRAEHFSWFIEILKFYGTHQIYNKKGNRQTGFCSLYHKVTHIALMKKARIFSNALWLGPKFLAKCYLKFTYQLLKLLLLFFGWSSHVGLKFYLFI